jgi:hypothetical protein
MAHFGNAIFQWNDHNLLSYSEDFGQWAASLTPVLSSGQTDPFGGSQAYSIEDDNAVNAESIALEMAASVFTSTSQKAAMLWVKAGTSTEFRLTLRDNNAAVNRMLADVDWVSSGPSVSMTVGSLLWHRQFTGGWWHLGFLSNAVTAGSSHEFRIRPAVDSTGVGTLYAFGAQVCDVSVAGSYVMTNGTAIAYSTDAPAQEHSLQAPIRALRPAVRVQPFVRESLDLAHRQITTVADPRHETIGTIKYESDQDSFHAFLSAAARFPVSHIPSSCNLDDAHECWAIVNDPLDSAMDADRGFPGFEDVSLDIRLRRLDGQASTGIYG